MSKCTCGGPEFLGCLLILSPAGMRAVLKSVDECPVHGQESTQESRAVTKEEKEEGRDPVRTFRADNEVILLAQLGARILGMNRSAFIRRAIREEAERVFEGAKEEGT